MFVIKSNKFLQIVLTHLIHISQTAIQFATLQRLIKITITPNSIITLVT